MRQLTTLRKYSSSAGVKSLASFDAASGDMFTCNYAMDTQHTIQISNKISKLPYTDYLHSILRISKSL